MKNEKGLNVYDYRDMQNKGRYPAFRDYIKSGTSEPEHYHDFLELVYVMNGTIIHTVDGKEYETVKGDMIMIDTSQSHGMFSADGAAYGNIIILPEFISDNLNISHTALDLFAYFLISNEGAEKGQSGFPLIRFRGNDLICVDNLVNEMCDEVAAKRENYYEVASNYLNILLYLIMRNIKESEKSVMSDISEAIPGIIDYLDKNCSNVTLNDIAKKYYYSPSYFSRAFKKYFNKNFSAYMQELKVEKIIRMLQESDVSIEDISDRLGFSDKRELYRVFKNVTGTTPSSYRKKSEKSGK